jgi:flagellar biosynthesis protein FlhA
MAIIGMMIIPLPPMMLDILITLNIAVAITMLLVSLYILEPLQFSSFPSLLLLATLFRLALNISSSRSILMHGYAGDVIMTFGHFVVGGNLIVGLVIFLILVIIQFVVITNGAGRVAEVAARFTLDAMPGKQMAIDADLNAGMITEEQARTRRESIHQEASFYGAMDGASKFVKGDAIAGIVIMVVNIIGGIATGVLQQGMPAGEALSTYALLTVGDGLVSQIPALLISTATGIIVTRSGSGASLSTSVVGQMFGNPRALMVGGGLMLTLGLMPGLPKLPFIITGIMLIVSSRFVGKRQNEVALEEAEAIAPASAEDDMMQYLQVDPMELEIGYGLIPLVDEKQGGHLLSRITIIRKQVAMDLGIILPTIRIRDNLELQPNQYRVRIRGAEVATGEVYPDRLMAMNAGGATGDLEGISGIEPAFGLPATWITEGQRMEAEMHGYTVVDPSSIVTTHLNEVIRKNAADLLRRQDVQKLLDNVRRQAPAVVDELVPHMLVLGEIQQVLQFLLREGVSVRDLVTILETLGNFARQTKDIPTLGEQVRASLAPIISRQYVNEDGNLYVLTLQPDLTNDLADMLHPTEIGPQLALDPDRLQRLLSALAKEMERVAGVGRQPILLVPATIRLALRRAIERSLPNLVVLSYREIAPNVQVHASGSVRI